MPRPRFTLAVAAMVLGGAAWGQRMRKLSAAYWAKANHHLQSPPVIFGNGPAKPDPWREYHAAMYEKYEFAARHPWLAVGPDPPEPPLPDFLSTCGAAEDLLFSPSVAPDPPEPR